MTTALSTRIALSAAAALSLAGGLTACATESEAPASASGEYADGKYNANADYRSPGGTEKIGVTLTLKGNTIDSVEVVGRGSSPEAIRYQGEFIDGISAEVVGKNIDEVQVDRVAGSSLTSSGFMKALATIKEEAAA